MYFVARLHRLLNVSVGLKAYEFECRGRIIAETSCVHHCFVIELKSSSILTKSKFCGAGRLGLASCNDERLPKLCGRTSHLIPEHLIIMTKDKINGVLLNRVILGWNILLCAPHRSVARVGEAPELRRVGGC